MARFVILNQSSLVSTDLEAMAAAIDHQLREHVATAWQRVPIAVQFEPDAAHLTPEDITFTLVDGSSPQSGMFGGHTPGMGGKSAASVIFVSPVLAIGGDPLIARDDRPSVASVLSHEVIETFLDADCNQWVDTGTLLGSCALEIADPVQADWYSVTLPSKAVVSVSNFVYPSWFRASSAPWDRLDHMGRLYMPCTLSLGGYAVVRPASGGETIWIGGGVPQWKAATWHQQKARARRRMSSRGYRSF
jgi:hypothetical protein